MSHAGRRDDAGVSATGENRPVSAVRRLLITVLALATAALVVVPGTAASAHTALVSSSPKAGATLHELPTEVRLTFTEDLAAEVTQVRVVDGEGLSMTEGKPSTEGPTVTQALATTLHPGSYVVTYKVISADGHPVSGAVPFTVAEDAVAAPTQPESAPGPTANGAPSSSTAPAATTSPATVAAPATTASDDGSADRDGGINGWLLGLALAGVAVAFGVLGWRYRAQR